MLNGFVPFPPALAQQYREKGYWKDQSLAQEFDTVFHKFADRVALVDGDQQFTYAELDRLTTNLALNLLELGLKPLDRVVPTLPNVHEFVVLYFALQKIGAIPIAALVTHRYAEISQFVNLSSATTCVYPDTSGDFAFGAVIDRVHTDSRSLQVGDLFVALRGERFDGNQFIAQAKAQGAVAVVCEASGSFPACPDAAAQAVRAVLRCTSPLAPSLPRWRRFLCKMASPVCTAWSVRSTAAWWSTPTRSRPRCKARSCMGSAPPCMARSPWPMAVSSKATSPVTTCCTWRRCP